MYDYYKEKRIVLEMPLEEKVFKAYGQRLLNYCAFYNTLLKDVDVIKKNCDLKNCPFYLIVYPEEYEVLRKVYERKEFRREYQQKKEDVPRLKI